MTTYITVVGRDPVRTIQAYLYGGVDIETSGLEPERTWAILSTDVEGSLAQNQADRLASGLYGTKVFTDRAEAVKFLRETFGVEAA